MAKNQTYKVFKDLIGFLPYQSKEELFSTSGGRVSSDRIYRSHSLHHRTTKSGRYQAIPEATLRLLFILAFFLLSLIILPASLFAQSPNPAHLSFQQLTDSTIHYFQKLGDCEKALPFALPRRDSIRMKFGPRSLEYAKTCRFIGEVYTRLSRFEEAEASFKIALPLADSLLPAGDGRRANFYAASGFYHLEKGAFGRAVYLYRQVIALQPMQSRNDTIARAWQERYLGKACYLSNRSAEAEEHLLVALQLFRQLYGPVHLDVAEACHFIGNFQYHIRNYRRAIFWFNEAEKSLPDLESRQPLIEAIELKIIVSSTFIKLKDYRSARFFIDEATVLYQKLYAPNQRLDSPDLLNMAKLDLNLGLTKFYENAFPKAEISWRNSLKVRESLLPLNHPDVLNTRLNLALVLAFQGCQMQADSLFRLVRSAMEPESEGENYRLNLLLLEEARLALERGRREEALKCMDSLESNLRRQVDAIFLDFASAENEAFFLSLDVYREWINGLLASDAEKQPALASRLLDVHLNLHGILLSSERSVLQDLRRQNEPLLAQKAETWFALRKQLAALQANGKIKADSLSAFEEKVNSLEKELIRQRSNRKGGFSANTRAGSEIQKTLKKGQAAVQIIRVAMPGMVTFTDHSDSLHRSYVYPDITDTIHYLALILKPGNPGPVLVSLRRGNWLERQGLANYRNQIRWQQDDPLSYGLFWQVIDSALGPEVKEVFYCPDGVYHSLNPASVLVPGQQRYLSELRSWVRLTRLADLNEPAPERNNQKQAVLIGAPAFADGYRLDGGEEEQSRFKPLPGTLSEVNSVNRALQKSGWKTSCFTGTTASEEAVKNLRSPAVLHLATHGYFRQDTLGGSHAMLSSGLILAGPDKAYPSDSSRREDGILKAREAQTLDLEGTDLVVLSACETGLGTSLNGEGMYGLQRAFQLAGCRRVLMSLWKIDDEATSRLMKAFYKFYLPSGNAQDALLKAQAELRKSYPHPYHWASFLVMGR